MKEPEKEKENINTATLTFHSPNNYGALAQAYALQRTLIKLGFNNVILNYQSPYMKKPYGVSAFKRKGLIRYLLGIAYSIVRYPRNKNFSALRHELNITQKLSQSDMASLENTYDYFIVGSDQVWNDDINNLDPTYFLNFVTSSEKKKSYAASFGFTELPEEKKTAYYGLLESFSSYNMRETSGVEIIENLLGRPANLTLDPTLLLDRAEWNTIAVTPKIRDKYILVYQITFSASLIRAVKVLAKHTGYIVVAIPFPLGGFVASKINLTAGPKEWVGLIRDAELIITDSFHGCALSIIYNKKFKVFLTGAATRIESLINMLGLDTCLIGDYKDCDLDDDIDWERVNMRLEDEKKKSIDRLLEMLNGNN
jgi:hypothetical protein